MKRALIIANMLIASATVWGMDGNVNEDWKSVRQNRMMQLYGQPQDEVLESVAEMFQKAEKSAEEVAKLRAAKEEIRNVINKNPETRKQFFSGIQYGLNLRKITLDKTIDDIEKSSSEEIRSELLKRGHEISVSLIEALSPVTIQSIFSNVDRTLSFNVSAVIMTSNLINSESILQLLLSGKNQIRLTTDQIWNLCVSAFRDFSDWAEACKQEAPLHYAYEKGNTNIIKPLVNLGMDINQQDSNSDGDTLLIKASREGDIDSVKYFVSRGADIKQANSKGNTPLCVAYFAEKEDVTKYLIDNYEDMNIVFTQQGDTLLYDAQQSARIMNGVISDLSSESASTKNSNLEKRISKLSERLSFYENIIQYLKDRGATE